MLQEPKIRAVPAIANQEEPAVQSKTRRAAAKRAEAAVLKQAVQTVVQRQVVAPKVVMKKITMRGVLMTEIMQVLTIARRIPAPAHRTKML